jgi:hypothetical protein
MSSERNNQLTQVSEYDVQKMVFSEPQFGSVPNTPISYRRINISTLNKDGSIGDLILPTERVFCFGVSENKNPETQKVNGHVLPLCLWNKDRASENEKAWTDTFDRIVEQCKKHLIENREEIEQYDLSMADLKKLNPLYWKRDKGKIIEGTGPTLYAKLIASKKNDKILSIFFNKNGVDVDPLSLLGKRCFAKAAIKIESIFIGNKITLQVKVYEAEIELLESGMKSLLQRQRGSGRLIVGNSNTLNEMKQDDTEDEYSGTTVNKNDSGSLPNSDAEDEVQVPKSATITTVPKKTIKVVKRTVVKQQ